MKNSDATLVRGMREVLSGMSGVESYIDDLIVFSSDWKTYLRTLEKLLKRLSEADLTARPSKCIFGASSVEFLGHNVVYDWITPNDDNLDKIARAKRPVTKKEVCSFCGLLGYYRDYIPSFAIIAVRLTYLTKKGQPNFVEWGESSPEEAHIETARSFARFHSTHGCIQQWNWSRFDAETRRKTPPRRVRKQEADECGDKVLHT